MMNFCEHTTAAFAHRGHKCEFQNSCISRHNERGSSSLKPADCKMARWFSQDSQVFNTSGLSGTYTFGFLKAFLQVRQQNQWWRIFCRWGPGHTGTGKITSGELDINSGGTSVRSFKFSTTSFYSIGHERKGHGHTIYLLVRR